MKKTPAETLIRHRQYRELFETFMLFSSLALLLLCAGTLMIKIQAPAFLIVMPFVFALPCFVASVLKSICYFAHWVEQVGLPEDRNAYSVVLRQISNRLSRTKMKSIFVTVSLLALAFPA